MKPRQLVLFAATLLAWNFSGSAFGIQLTTYSKNFPVTTGTLQVNTGAGDIRIQTGKPEVQINVVGIDEADLPNLIVKHEGSIVSVDFRPTRGRNQARFEIGVPSALHLVLKTSGGDISISGEPLVGNAEASTSGGDISAETIKGALKLSTAGGDISAGVVHGDTQLNTAGGDISVDQVLGKVQAKTAGGDIRIGDVTQSLQASTSGGDIHLANVGGDATAKTAGGDIQVGNVAGSASLSTAGGDIELESAKGVVRAKTAGGDLNLMGITGRIEGSTAGGDVTAELTGAGQDPSSLETKGGDITLFVADGVGATIDAVIEVSSGSWESKSKKFQIQSEFGPVSESRDSGSREISATFPVNGGGAKLTLRTVNGNISIKKAQQ